MILITGGSGFIGRHLIRQLSSEGRKIKVLLRPSDHSPRLPKGIATDVAISSLSDERGLRAAMVDVDAIYHLAGVNWQDRRLDWFSTEVEGTRALLSAAADANVKRIITLSHLGADRASAYPLLKSKAIVEEDIRKTNMKYTIIRSGLVFGQGDNFTEPMAQLMAISPGIFPISGDGQSLLQPIWVEDIVSCLAWSLDHEECMNALIEIGGPEHLTLNNILAEISQAIGVRRKIAKVRPSYFRYLASSIRFIFPGLPISNVWVDYLASNRVSSLDEITKVFGIMPSRFSHRLQHLKKKNWRSLAYSKILGRQSI